MNTFRKTIVNGVLSLGLAACVLAAQPALAQNPAGGNCHYNTVRLVAPNVQPNTYRPGYVSDQELIRQLNLQLGRGIPLNQVNIQQLRSNHVIGVSNGAGGFNHCAAIVVDKTGQVRIEQRFDTSSNHYQQRFQNGQSFINQTVTYGGQMRQPYQNNTNRVQVYCPNGCTQHRR